MGSWVPLMYHDPSDLGSLVLIQITPKKRTLSYEPGRLVFISDGVGVEVVVEVIRELMTYSKNRKSES